jgi:hypothetical protein
LQAAKASGADVLIVDTAHQIRQHGQGRHHPCHSPQPENSGSVCRPRRR